MYYARSSTLHRLTIAAITLGLSASATAQTPGGTASEFAQRSSGSLSVIQMRPQGALARNIGFGYGIDGALLFRLDRRGIFALRADVGAIDYGDESKRVAFSETVGDRVKVNVRTTNYIVPMSIGPQISRPSGLVRPYVNVGLGGQAFFTESSVEGAEDYSVIASSVNHSAFAAAWTTGAGVYIPLHAGSANVLFDIGAQYFHGGRSQYLARGSITDLPGGAINISPMESSTHLIVLRIGVKVGL